MATLVEPPLRMAEHSTDTIRTRHSLLNRLKDLGDQASWQDFFDTYWRLIYNVAVKAGLTDTEAQEVVQETVIAVARKISEFKADPAHGSFSAWLMRLTRWRIADQFRQRGKAGVQASACLSGEGTLKRERQPDDTGLTDTVDRIPDPDGVAFETMWGEEWERNLLAAALEQVKRQVSPKQYQMFDLHVLQNLSVQHAAHTLQVSTASVYMAKHRVGRLLKKAIKELQKKTV